MKIFYYKSVNIAHVFRYVQEKSLPMFDLFAVNKHYREDIGRFYLTECHEEIKTNYNENDKSPVLCLRRIEDRTKFDASDL